MLCELFIIIIIASSHEHHILNKTLGMTWNTYKFITLRTAIEASYFHSKQWVVNYVESIGNNFSVLIKRAHRPQPCRCFPSRCWEVIVHHLDYSWNVHNYDLSWPIPDSGSDWVEWCGCGWDWSSFCTFELSPYKFQIWQAVGRNPAWTGQSESHTSTDWRRSLWGRRRLEGFSTLSRRWAETRRAQSIRRTLLVPNTRNSWKPDMETIDNSI